MWIVCTALILLAAGAAGWWMRSRGWSGRWILGLAVLVILALFVLGRMVTAGEDDERITRTLETVYTSENPRICDELTTPAYLEQAMTVEPPYADEACEARLPLSNAAAIEVTEIDVDEDSATALVRGTGGHADGSVRRVELVEEDGTWKLDRVTGFASFDRRRWERSWHQEFLAFGSSAAAADCAVAKARALSDEEVESRILDDPKRVFARFVVECDREGIRRNVLAAAASAEIELPPGAVACAEGQVDAAGDAELLLLQEEPRAFAAMVLQCDPNSYYESLKRRLIGGDYTDRAAAECIADGLGVVRRETAIRLLFDDERYQALIERCEERTGAGE